MDRAAEPPVQCGALHVNVQTENGKWYDVQERSILFALVAGDDFLWIPIPVRTPAWISSKNA